MISETRKRIQLDAEVVCLTCHTYFTIHDIGRNLNEGDGSITHISAMGCPNCRQTTLDFSLVSIQPKYSTNDVINFVLERHGMKTSNPTVTTISGSGGDDGRKKKRRGERRKMKIKKRGMIKKSNNKNDRKKKKGVGRGRGIRIRRKQEPILDLTEQLLREVVPEQIPEITQQQQQQQQHQQPQIQEYKQIDSNIGTGLLLHRQQRQNGKKDNNNNTNSKNNNNNNNRQ